ncbi:unnamed protein product, partial [Amoebophrya sp. A120]|eukprot:GSA120T00004385001.1
MNHYNSASASSTATPRRGPYSSSEDNQGNLKNLNPAARIGSRSNRGDGQTSQTGPKKPLVPLPPRKKTVPSSVLLTDEVATLPKKATTNTNGNATNFPGTARTKHGVRDGLEAETATTSYTDRVFANVVRHAIPNYARRKTEDRPRSSCRSLVHDTAAAPTKSAQNGEQDVEGVDAWFWRSAETMQARNLVRFETAQLVEKQQQRERNGLLSTRGIESTQRERRTERESRKNEAYRAYEKRMATDIMQETNNSVSVNKSQNNLLGLEQSYVVSKTGEVKVEEPRPLRVPFPTSSASLWVNGLQVKSFPTLHIQLQNCAGSDWKEGLEYDKFFKGKNAEAVFSEGWYSRTLSGVGKETKESSPAKLWLSPLEKDLLDTVKMVLLVHHKEREQLASAQMMSTSNLQLHLQGGEAAGGALGLAGAAAHQRE